MNPQDVFAALRSGDLTAEEAESRLRALLAPATAPEPHDRGVPEPSGDEDGDEDVVRWLHAEPGIALVVMEDRAHKNTFSSALVSGLTRAFAQIEADESVRVVVLTGYDSYFASGGTKDGLLAIQEGRVKFTDLGVYHLPLDCRLPVIAAMQGHGIGAGWSMGMFCDFAVFSSESYYTSNYMKYGFTPGAGATLIFPERFGGALAREILFAGRTYRGSELAERGVPFPVVPRSQVRDTALEFARELAQAPRESLIGLKSLLAESVRGRVAGSLERELDMHERTFVNKREVRDRIQALFGGGASDAPKPVDRTRPTEQKPQTPQTAEMPQTAQSAERRKRGERGEGDSRRAIAVIGMAGQFPMAPDLGAFWDNLVAGRDCVSEVPPSRWPLEAYVDPDPKALGKTYSKWMGTLETADAFDPLFFNISPVEAEHMDPQQRIFLTSSWHCVENAGIAPSALSGTRCGVFVGCGPSEYGQYLMRKGDNPQGFTGAASSILSARIAYLLNLKGPNLAIDTACSSSLVAIAEACDSLLLGNSDLALAGGVSVLSGPSMHVMTSKAGMLSRDGRCKTFDAGADGFVPGEGVGVVLLKRLDDAVRDGDPIRGVIRGWGVNQDGRTNGMTAPSAASQARLERDVYERFGIDPETITMVEAHGTGTKLGDPIEVEALTEAFRTFTDRTGYCSLGSVKSNIGHLLTAAGIAGVLKVLLSLHHGTRAPTLHLETVNEHIALEEGPFYLNTEAEPWDATDGVPRRAAVSSFGFSGTNAHLVIEEYVPEPAPPRRPALEERQRPVLLVLSAKTERQLRSYAARFRDAVTAADTLDLADWAHTTQVARDPLKHRMAVVAASRAELLTALTGFVDGGAPGAWATQPGELSATGALARAADEWLSGGRPDWDQLWGDQRPRRIPLPGYPFADERYWLAEFRDSFGCTAPEPAADRPAVPDGDAASPPPDDATEVLTEELSRLLNIDRQRLSPETAFHEIGVDSLAVQRLLDRLEDVFGEIPAEAFFTHKTIGALAGFLADRGPARPTAPQAAPGPARPDTGTRTAPATVGEASARGDIAVVGVSGRYPKAPTLQDFWTNLEFARDCVVEIPKERWDPRDYGSRPGARRGKGEGMYCTWGGFLPDVDRFDADFFGISPLEAKHMDPQERLFLETAAACLEDAGYARERLHDATAADGRASVGVFVGATFNNYQLHQAESYRDGHFTPVNSQLYSIANRVSYLYNLRGPSMSVDTACSSSLLAVHLACESIRSGESEMALAGGVNLSLHPSKYVSLCAGQFAASDGRCRSFGKDGDGYVPGEGVGAVLLKPLAAAERDGDHIYGVIRATAVNNDGRTFGYSVPNPTAQAEVIGRALEKAGVDARTISYVEAHGTGTKLGDPVEVAGLTQAYAKDTEDTQFCAIGSVKSGIGHLEAAAGIAQLTKVLLQLKHRRLAASLTHSDELNPHIDFEATPFRVQRVTGEWRRPVITSGDGSVREVPRRAGISSFGAGGVNVHAIVEEYTPAAAPGAPATPVIMPLSARSASALQARAASLRAHLASAREQPGGLGAVAHTLQTGRDAHEHRLAFVATDAEDAVHTLDAYLQGTGSGARWYTGQVAVDGTRTSLGAPAPARLEETARAWTRGAVVDWSAYQGGTRPTRVPLPTYPFEGDRFWTGRTGSGTGALTRPPRQREETAASGHPVPLRPHASAGSAPDAPTGPEEPAAVPPPGTSAVLAALAEAMEFERDDILTAFLRERLAELLDYPPSELPDSDRGFFDLGMESVMVEKFRLSIEAELGVCVPDTAIFEHPSVAALTAHLRELIAWDDIERIEQPAAPASAAAADDSAELADVAAQLRQELVELGAIAKQ
ncbi:beta-ketoacyl synthase N-terminal-like domain-containing protein [Streptomyces albus]|uniref:beta-ketoacyl synthase N-terminal-like domain-containing protein n=1 Tax=Streptomyces albus TaxID=1888 RepID=UPI00068B5962|nr:beta-ketoacyl synthase N-terminal-like domain-containing protein [Streptomyces albus]